MPDGIDCANDEIPLEYINMCLAELREIPGGITLITAALFHAKVGMQFVTFYRKSKTSKTRGQPATIIPRPAQVIEILQGAYFPEVSHSVLQ